MRSSLKSSAPQIAPQPRFGWTNLTHGLMTGAAIDSLPAQHRWTQFLQANRDAIVSAAASANSVTNGPHYLDLEEALNIKIKNDMKAEDHFAPDRRRRFESISIAPKLLSHVPFYQAFDKFFQDSVGALNTITTVDWQIPSQRIKHERTIAVLLGRLLHYNQDRWQPFHTTKFHKGQRRSKQTDGEFEAIASKKTVVQPGTPEHYRDYRQFQDHLLASLKSTWLSLFTLFENKHLENWPRVVTTQVNQAVSSSAGLLQLVWDHAQKTTERGSLVWQAIAGSG